MKYKKIIFLLVFTFFIQGTFAQKTVILENVRCFSSIGPVMEYWRDEALRKTFISDLRSSLLHNQDLLLPDTSKVSVDLLTNLNGAGQVKFFFTDTAAGLLHLYLDIYEMGINNFSSYILKNYPDTNLQKNAVSVFMLKATIVDGYKTNVYADELYIAVTPGESQGIGFPYNNFNGYGQLPGSPKGFSGILSKGMDILLDTANKLVMVEMRVAPAYIADNYLLGRVTALPRVMVTSQKGMSRYTYGGKVEMIRMGEALYEEIILKGKKAGIYPTVIMNAIRNAKNNQASDFVFLRQDCRDVARDKNYLIKLAVQIDPDFRANGPKTVFTNFLEERIHYLLNDKDTVASFTIRKNLLNTEGKKIYLNQVSNGSDVNSIFRMDNTSEWMIRYNYTLSGIINGKYFSILCAGTDNSVKEFYLEGKMVCVSEGGNSLKKFVVIDASLNAELLNQLFIIGFNAFIE